MRVVFCIVISFSLFTLRGQITLLNSGTTTDITFLSVIGNNILIGGHTKNFLAKSYHEGKQLIPVSCPGPSINFNGFQRLDTNNVFMVSNGNGSTLYRSYDGGSNWNNKYYNGYGLGAVFFDTLEAIALVDLYGQKLRTTNGGVAWTTTTNSPVWATACYKTFGDSTVIWGEISMSCCNFYLSNDRGHTWPFAWGMGGSPSDFAFLNKDTIVGVSYPLGNTDPTCMFTKTINGGLNWKNTLAPLQYPRRILLRSKNECYVIGKNKGFAAIAKTTDLGETWSIYQTNISAELINMALLNDSVALLTGTAGTLLQWNFKRTVYTSIQTVKNQVPEFSIYPNPAEDNLTVECNGRNTLQIFDALGKGCGVYILEKGKNTISVTSLPKGIYFCRFEYLQRDAYYKIIIR